MAKSSEPLWWFLFAGGGVVAAFLVPVHILLTGIAAPLGWAPQAFDYDRIASLTSHPLVRLYLFVLISAPLFHWAHRFRHTLFDLGLRVGRGLVATACYGTAFLGSLVAAVVLQLFLIIPVVILPFLYVGFLMAIAPPTVWRRRPLRERIREGFTQDRLLAGFFLLCGLVLLGLTGLFAFQVGMGLFGDLLGLGELRSELIQRGILTSGQSLNDFLPQLIFIPGLAPTGLLSLILALVFLWGKRR
ncbi:MAG: hypothetical protein HYZ68_00735 [Chloroflexi bacterium]|nr:hypothetical protein [Chloroflexota bacterium]